MNQLFGWVDGVRVPLAAMPEEDLSMEDGGGAGWWPSESTRVVWLEALSRREAGEISAAARRELMWWLAADGLHPVQWARRWTSAMWRLCPDRVPSEAASLWGAGSKFERAVMGAFFPSGGSTAVVCRRIDGVFAGLSGKLATLPASGGLEGGLDGMLSGERGLAWCGWAGVESEVAAAEAGEVVRLAMVGLARWLSEDGGWSLGALKRFYVMVFVRYRDLAPGMTGQDFASIYGQTRAAFCEDAKRYVGLPLESLLGFRPKVAGQKSAESAGAYADNAAAHCPRRQIGGVQFSPERTEEERRRMADDRLASVRAEAERRELARDAAAMEDLAARNRERARRGRV